MSDYESCATEILRQLEPDDSKLLAQTLDHLKERWEVSDGGISLFIVPLP